MTVTPESLKARKNSTELLWKHFKHRISKQEKALESRNAAVLAHQKLVQSEAHKMASRCRVSYEDLEQLGMIGLVRAVERFDPTMGVSFSSFAVPYIRGQMLHHLRDHGSSIKVPRRMREANAAAGKIERQWVAVRGKAPTETETAAEMGITVQKLRNVRAAIANQMALPLQEEYCDIPAPETYTLNEESNGRLERAWSQLRTNLQQLHPSEQELIRLVYFNRLSINAVAKLHKLDAEALRGKLNRILLRIAN
jgi:RNA polymerase sigma-B factor